MDRTINLSPFFQLIWKINAVLILVAGLMVCGLLSYAGYNVYKEHSRRYSNDVVNVEPDANISAEWRLGGFERIGETDYLIAAAYSQQNYDVAFESSSKEATAVRNYLFVNATDKTSRWLTSSNNQLFLESENVSRIDESQTARMPKWKMYQVVKADSNGDGRLTGNDKRIIALSDAVGTNYAEVISDIDSMLGSEMRDDDTVLIFYASSGRNYVAEINIPERRVTVTKELPQIQR